MHTSDRSSFLNCKNLPENTEQKQIKGAEIRRQEQRRKYIGCVVLEFNWEELNACDLYARNPHTTALMEKSNKKSEMRKEGTDFEESFQIVHLFP
jgi:hypothetical protein